MDNTKTLLLLGLATGAAAYYFKKSKEKKAESEAIIPDSRKKITKDNDVLKLQKILNRCGYGLTEDGILGSKTQAALKDYKAWKDTPVLLRKSKPNCVTDLSDVPIVVKYGL